jgi:hypothetical protein
MAEAADKGIPLEDYIKVQPEPLVRVKLDRGELRYTWDDADGRHRASDDGGPQPPKGWWTANSTTIDRERREVRANALLTTFTQTLFFVRVFPGTPADTSAKPKGRPRTKFDLALEILADIDQREGLASNLQPAEIEKKVRLKVPREFRRRWAKLGPDGQTKPPMSRTVIYRAYQQFLRDRDDHGHGAHAELAGPARSRK